MFIPHPHVRRCDSEAIAVSEDDWATPGRGCVEDPYITAGNIRERSCGYLGRRHDNAEASLMGDEDFVHLQLDS